MSEIKDQNGEQRSAAINDAAAELGDRLKKLADTLAARQKPERVRYGRGRLGNNFKRLSPEGFVLDPVALQMVLPDGRLWTYRRSDSARFPEGRYFDPRTDYVQFSGSRTFPGGREFVFLGAVLGKYTFGLAGDAGSHGVMELCAISGEGRSVRYLTADEAFTLITDSVPVPSSGAEG